MEELSACLKSHGLDESYWLLQLKDMGIQTKEAFLFLQGDMIPNVRAKARNKTEEKALLSLISNKSGSLKNILMTQKQPRQPISHGQENPQALVLLRQLGLTEFYPKKLQLSDALCIKLEPLKLSLGKLSPTESCQLPHLVLHKLMSYDSLCRSDLMPILEENEFQTGVGNESDSENQSNSDSESFESCCSSLDISSVSNKGVHPVDCILSLIICSDDFLRQDLFSRLAKCQLAVPFILQDPFTKEPTLPLWGLRSIIKEWDCTEVTGKVVKKTQPIISYKMPIVSFIRLGKHQKHDKSKSAILNEVISDSHYDHFFHRECHGGDYQLLLGEGLVDMCWYLPGKTANAFPDAVTFLNLHGDAREYSKQARFLSQISSMCFILLTEENLEINNNTENILKNFGLSSGNIVILSCIKNLPKLFKKKLTIIDLSKNVFRIKDAIRTQIRKKMEYSHTFYSIEEFCNNEEATILIDEHNDTYKLGLSMATEVINMKKVVTRQPERSTNEGNKASKVCVKDIILPLQGEALWKTWAASDKELKRQIRRGDKSVNDYTEEIIIQKTKIRKEQLEYVESLSPVMESFIVSLLKLGGPSNRVLRNYFLQCLKLELNNISRECISGLQHQYQSARKELSILQGNSVPLDDTGSKIKVESLKKRLEDLQDEIINSSFGLEHLFRELGQVYEAAREFKLFGKNLSHLPEAAAELLIEGYPLELMDGDAAHVPLQWVTAVLQEAIIMLNDPNVFVLSVLGLQSTGKSTLLNTAFGLQFNVSAGRCTRGAFMQLLPLGDELKKQTKCSYILVVDTEGLRAPELDPLKTQKHDNELATFVIGLANSTLINIYGEVPGDMDDILQTSVHAFLRMSEVKFSPSCQFIHQNVGQGGSASSDVGRAKFTHKLNQFTLEAAKQENCEGEYKCFNDVIKFSDQTDVHYFPGLWKGDPPMAPVNQGYSKSAQELKLHVIEILCKKLTSTLIQSLGDLHLSAFKIKLQDLWTTLLKENFVFSFKNTLEITAYNSLETEYSKWDWEFREAMLKWEQIAENEINAVEAQSATTLAKKKCDTLHEFMTKLHQPIVTKMKTFFCGKRSEILVQWKAKFERRLENLKEELKIHAEKHCMKLGKSREAISKFEQDQKHYTAIITSQVQDHIASLRQEQEEFNQCLNEGKLTNDQLCTILRRKLFTTESLIIYKEKKLISNDQAETLQMIIDNCNGDLTPALLNTILFEGIIGIEQAKQILIKAKQSEEELAIKFDEIWFDIIAQLPYTSSEMIIVQHEIEKVLIDYARTISYDSQLIEIIQRKRDIRTWGARLEFYPVEGIHYKKPGNVLRRIYHSITRSGEAQIKAVAMTEKVFDVAYQSLKHITTRQATDFKPVFAQEFLRDVDTAITRESRAVKDQIIFTTEYRCTLLIMVCGYAIPEFEKMAQSFMERTDPRVHLEKHVKKPLFTKFKNQYYQTEAEDTIASTICAHLEVPIKEQVKKTIGTIMVRKMKGSEHYFISKMALKVKVLNDLHTENKYENYMAFVKNVKRCLQDRIKLYTIHYSDRQTPKGSRLQISAKEEVDRLIAVVENTVTEVNKTVFQEWLIAFSKHQKLTSELGYINVDTLLTGFESLKELNLGNFKLQIREKLLELKKTLYVLYDSIQCEEDMNQWKDKPHELLADLIGCTEQCPFCGEQCDILDPNHYDVSNQKHRSAIHRPSCLAGWRWIETEEMITDFCTSLVASDKKFLVAKTEQWHPYKQYREIHPDWSIDCDPSSESCLYWKWFVSKYTRELADTYKAKPAIVPPSWNAEWSKVEENLKDAYAI